MLLALLVFTFVLLIPGLIEHAEAFIAKGVSPDRRRRRRCCTLVPSALALTIPMSVLVGLLVAFARLSADREFVAMQACGLSLARLLRPVGLVSILAWAATSYVYLVAVPDSNQALPGDRLQRAGVEGRGRGAAAGVLRRVPEPGAVRAGRPGRPAAAGTACSSPIAARARRSAVYVARHGRVAIDRAEADRRDAARERAPATPPNAERRLRGVPVRSAR